MIPVAHVYDAFWCWRARVNFPTDMFSCVCGSLISLAALCRACFISANMWAITYLSFFLVYSLCHTWICWSRSHFYLRHHQAVITLRRALHSGAVMLMYPFEVADGRTPWHPLVSSGSLSCALLVMFWDTNWTISVPLSLLELSCFTLFKFDPICKTLLSPGRPPYIAQFLSWTYVRAEELNRLIAWYPGVDLPHARPVLNKSDINFCKASLGIQFTFLVTLANLVNVHMLMRRWRTFSVVRNVNVRSPITGGLPWGLHTSAVLLVGVGAASWALFSMVYVMPNSAPQGASKTCLTTD